MSSISEVLSDLGYLGLALAGYLVGQGHFEFVPALIAATAGSLVGAVLLEGAARRQAVRRPVPALRASGRGHAGGVIGPLATPALVLAALGVAGVMLWRALRGDRSD